MMSCLFCYMFIRFREIKYAKGVSFPNGIFLSNAKQKKPIVGVSFVLRNNEISEVASDFKLLEPIQV